MTKSLNNRKGFGLIELLVTIAIFAILLAVATPNFSNILSRKDINSGSATLIQALNKAKKIAHSESTRVRVTVSGSKITLVKANDDTNPQYIHLPKRINAGSDGDEGGAVAIMFNADGLVFNFGGDQINNATNIQIQARANASVNRTISITSLGMIASL